jgi:GntR family transcriptional regulator
MEFGGKKAIYLQIADFICEQILLQKWLEKQKIPSIRELAVSLQVNPNTVTRTYAFLEEQGMIEIQRGVGYFVAKNARDHVFEFKKKEFVTMELPEIFRSMDLLNIDFEQFKKLYNERGKK